MKNPDSSTVALLPSLIKAALTCVHSFGTVPSRWSEPGAFVSFGTVLIIYQMPDILTHTTRHELQVWKDRRSVLHASWALDSDGPFKLFQVTRGAWINEIFQTAQHANLQKLNSQ